MGKPTIRTAKRRATFLTALAEDGRIGEACRVARMGRQSAYDWRNDDAEFAADWDIALEKSMHILEDEAKRRANLGVLEPIYQGGKRVGYKRRYSDTLLMFLLNGGMPDKYQRQRVEHSGPGGAAIQLEVKDVSLLDAARRVAYLLHTAALRIDERNALAAPRETQGET